MSTVMETPQTYQDILARVNDFNLQVKEAQAKETCATKIPEEDPRYKGEKGIPNLEETDDTNKTKNDKSTEDAKLEDESTHPVSTGKNVPSTQDGNAKEDAFTSPTTPLSKIAEVNERVAAISQRISQFAGGKSASEVVGKTEKAEKQEGSKEANTELAGDFSDEFLRKMAYAIVETEGGLEAVEPILLKHAGQEEARELLTKAASEYDNLVALSEQIQNEEMYKMAAEYEAVMQAEELLKSASEDEREMILKTAAVHDENCSQYDDYLLKVAYMAGAGDAAAMMDEEAAMPEGEEAGLPGAAQGEPSVEEIVQLLDAMVASGEIDEETAAQVVEQLAGGGMEDGMGGEEEAMMAAEGGGMPLEEGMIAEASEGSSADALYAKLIQKPA